MIVLVQPLGLVFFFFNLFLRRYVPFHHSLVYALSTILFVRSYLDSINCYNMHEVTEAYILLMKACSAFHF